MLFEVPDGKRALRIFFEEPTLNISYQPTIRPDWNTLFSIATKKTTGFTIRFATQAPPEGGVVQVEVPGVETYSTEQIVQRLNRRLQQVQQRAASTSAEAWRRGVERAQREAFSPAAQSRYAQAMHRYMQSTNRRFLQAQQRATQTRLVETRAAKRQVQKKKVDKDARLKALLKTSLGG